jgi:hypothetical protein
LTLGNRPSSNPTQLPRRTRSAIDIRRRAVWLAAARRALLSLLLARQGIGTILLESHADFDRDFRGDTIHPAIMEILDEIGFRT